MTTSTFAVMSLVLFSGILTGQCSSTIPVKEIIACMKKECSEASRHCGLNRECYTEECNDGIKVCLMYGFNLLYENSSYHRKKDFSVYDLVECAIDQCLDGVKDASKRLKTNSMQYKSGAAESFYSCLRSVRECVYAQNIKDEL